ncbi:hypothetical protein [Streptomyces javensis]|uniref:Uncharacterized protein n=1 Tax=Streptomyces javensis TaxID=114698 RepID=A0ABS0R2X2_9ACTN|nr:hypothetical protein [Streptomyces javensis]MBI0311640.1 hypothetical protein [Streptomyces javensis]
MSFTYTDPDGFNLLITRTTDEAGRAVLELSVSNPPDGDGWRTGSSVQIPAEKLLDGVRGIDTPSTGAPRP